MRRSTWITLVIIVGFVALLVFSIRRQAKAECELCLTFRGRSLCRSAAAATRQEATTAAHHAACAELAPGRNEGMLCNQVNADKLVCRDR